MKQFIFSHVSAIALFLFPGVISAQSAVNTDLASSYKRYLNVYEKAPIASNDYITGSSARIATGSVLSNDHDPAGKKLTTYLMTGSRDGIISLAENGDFSFTPNTNFSGASTTFSYKVCNNSLCSETATVTLSFPAARMIPMMLNDFMANNEGDKVVLNWNTAFENNNDHFDIERSTDGISFTKIGTVKGQGTTDVAHNYTFTTKISRQEGIKNDFYYRLKQVSLDQSASASKVLVVRVYRTKSLELVSVTPNPAVSDIKVNVQLNEASFVLMKITNSTGTEVIRKAAKSNQGLSSFTLEGSSNLEKGIYFLEMIVNSKERMTVKLIKD